MWAHLPHTGIRVGVAIAHAIQQIAVKKQQLLLSQAQVGTAEYTATGEPEPVSMGA